MIKKRNWSGEDCILGRNTKDRWFNNTDQVRRYCLLVVPTRDIHVNKSLIRIKAQKHYPTNPQTSNHYLHSFYPPSSHPQTTIPLHSCPPPPQLDNSIILSSSKPHLPRPHIKNTNHIPHKNIPQNIDPGLLGRINARKTGPITRFVVDVEE